MDKLTYDELYAKIHVSCEDAQGQGVKIYKGDISIWVKDEGAHLPEKEQRELVRNLWNCFRTR